MDLYTEIIVLNAENFTMLIQLLEVKVFLNAIVEEQLNQTWSCMRKVLMEKH